MYFIKLTNKQTTQPIYFNAAHIAIIENTPEGVIILLVNDRDFITVTESLSEVLGKINGFAVIK